MWFQLPYAWAIALLQEWDEHPPVHELVAGVLRAVGMLAPRPPRGRVATGPSTTAPSRELSRDEVIAELLGAGFRG